MLRKKESLLLKEISNFFLRIVQKEPSLQGLYISHVSLSSDYGICSVFFHPSDGKEKFEKKLPLLILYKPSLRSAIAKVVEGRYTSNLIFNMMGFLINKRSNEKAKN